jgi:hypothetical protein
VQHLSSFMRVISPTFRKPYLSVLQDIKNSDDMYQWRFRQELADQLCHLCKQFSVRDVYVFMCPLALSLATDSVSCVRSSANRLCGILLDRIYRAHMLNWAESFADSIVELSQNPASMLRQGFVGFCYHIALMVPGVFFAQRFGSALHALMTDRVVNVRLSVARVVSQIPLESFLSDSPDIARLLRQGLEQLRSDSDQDVRFYASREVGAIVDPNGDIAMRGDYATPKA